ncbi:MAG: hypothetical protein DRP57_02590 [Spirochaetes bacterium]|nr:MAG: hypothetical protein DRP57_02590 [Spirochaetota bacterium]
MRKSTKVLIAVFTVILSFLAIFTLVAAQNGKKTETTGKNTSEVMQNPVSTVPVKRDAYIPAGKQLEKFRPYKVIPLHNGILYGLSDSEGFLISFDMGKTWEKRDKGLPKKVIYPFKNLHMRSFTSIGIDPLKEQRVVLTTRNGIYLTENYGLSWEQIPVGKPLRTSSYFTASALSSDNRDAILVGTSFNGFFETADRGLTWTNPSPDLKFLYKGSGFYEEISGLSYVPGNPNIIYFASRFSGILYELHRKTGKISEIAIPGNEVLSDIGITKADNIGTGIWVVKADFKKDSLLYLPDRGTWITGTAVKSEKTDQYRNEIMKDERKKLASNKYGIYISAHRANGKYLNDHINFLKKHNLNSFVIDCKDDYGWLTYNSGLRIPGQMHAVKRWFNLDKVLKKAHENGLYVIARIVVFKDQQLFKYENYKYSVWDREADEPWRYIKQVKNSETGGTKLYQREYWVDPFSEFVWRYNISIARELQERGVDEIQFDYIRFPSDGNLSKIRYRFKKPGMTKIDAIESFLTMARKAIHIPISADLYGFNAWYRMGNWIGQSIEMVSQYADVVCPMFYPSHFPPDFLQDKNYLERAYTIYEEGTRRAKIITNNRALVRPFVQAFLIGSELNMTTAEYSDYLTSQLKGAMQASASGFTLWNASNKYYMVTMSLQPIINREKKNEE